jgi:hypothetical protein
VAPTGGAPTRPDTLFQLRHVITHNISVIARSDAAKLSLLVKGNVDAPRILSPTEPDVRSAKRFLDDTVNWVNHRVAQRLAELLTKIRSDNPSAFDARERADLVANQFTLAVTIAGSVGVLT